MRRLVPALLIATALAACGAVERSDERPAASPPAGSTRLTIEVTGTGTGPITVEHSCGASKPCDRAQLDELAAVARPADPQRACTLQYGGPEKARVTGTLEGEPVDVAITRTNGCGIADYQALFAALDRKPPLAG
jgi:hypothetical protein